MKIILGIIAGVALLFLCAIFIGKFIALGAGYGDDTLSLDSLCRRQTRSRISMSTKAS